MQAFLHGAEGGNPFLFRQVLENFKLKVINCVPSATYNFCLILIRSSDRGTNLLSSCDVY